MSPALLSQPLSTETELVSESAGKVFGMENFGNTCYCNSVLQCLYYSKSFREHILTFAPPSEMPQKVRRRLSVKGATPHPFTVDPSNATLLTSTGNSVSAQVQTQAATAMAMQAKANGQDLIPSTTTAPPPAPASAKPETKSLGRRISIFGKSNSKSGSAPNTSGNSTNGNSNSSDTAFEEGSSQDSDNTPQPVVVQQPAPVMDVAHTFLAPGSDTFASTRQLYPGLQGLALGVRYPGQNIPVVGFTEDPFATQETRKRNALVKGPIINLDVSFATNYGMRESLFTTLKDVFECMAENKSRIGVVAPAKLIEVLKKENELFRSSMHQDAHEFLNFLLNQVIENIDQAEKPNQPKPKAMVEASPKTMDNLFQGLLTSETKCLTCDTVSRRDEEFLDLSIDIERNSSITACLRQFSASEMLCERNKFNCDHCGGLHEAEKRMKIKKLPKILALHLKRFKYTENLQRNVKLFHRVVYPKFLRLDNTTEDAENPDKLYELYAVVVHIGGGPYHGHYVSVVKTETAGWLMFDDEMVEAVDPTYVFNFFGDNKGLATAYVLFYQEITQEEYERENLYTNKAHMAPSATTTAFTTAAPTPMPAASINGSTLDMNLKESTTLDSSTHQTSSGSETGSVSNGSTFDPSTSKLLRSQTTTGAFPPPAATGPPVRRKSVATTQTPNGAGNAGIQFWKRKEFAGVAPLPAVPAGSATGAPLASDADPGKKKPTRHLSFLKKG